MKTHPILTLIHTMAIVLILWQPAAGAEEGKGQSVRAYPGLYGPGPFGYRDRLEAQRMKALRARREARERERQALEQWEQRQGRWVDPWAEAMRSQMERRTQWLRQSSEAWWRWRNPRGAYIRDVMEAKQRYFDELAKQREKAFERTLPWSAFPY